VQIVKKDIMKKAAIHLSITLFIWSACTKPPVTNTAVTEIDLGNLQSSIQVGKRMDFYLEHLARSYKASLSPGRNTSSDKQHYFFLKFDYQDHNAPFHISEGDTLLVSFNNQVLTLLAYNSELSRQRLLSYYGINKWDLTDLGNANSIRVTINTSIGPLTAEFSDEIIFDYRSFAAKYVLGSNEEIPVPEKPTYQQPWGFMNGGFGKSFDFRLAHYINLITLNSDLGDFLSIGVGLAPFKYLVCKDYRGPDTFCDMERKTDYSTNINAMYGITYPSPLGNWSFEVGLTYHYYFSDERWNEGQDIYFSGVFPQRQYIRIFEGQSYRGSAWGFFLQAGGLWFSYNTKSIWTAGLAIPVPWW
jgi:hypothetical protein